MASRSTADQEFEIMVFSVGFVSTTTSREYRCNVQARTGTGAIAEAEPLIRLHHKDNYAIMSVEPAIQIGIVEVTGD